MHEIEVDGKLIRTAALRIRLIKLLKRRRLAGSLPLGAPSSDSVSGKLFGRSLEGCSQSCMRMQERGLERKNIQPRHVANTLHTLLESSCHLSPIWYMHGIVVTCSALDTRRVATVSRVASLMTYRKVCYTTTTTTSQRRIER